MFEKAASIFVTAVAGFMANIFKCTNILICKHTKAMRSYAFFAGQQGSNKNKHTFKADIPTAKYRL